MDFNLKISDFVKVKMISKDQIQKYFERADFKFVDSRRVSIPFGVTPTAEELLLDDLYLTPEDDCPEKLLVHEPMDVPIR